LTRVWLDRIYSMEVGYIRSEDGNSLEPDQVSDMFDRPDCRGSRTRPGTEHVQGVRYVRPDTTARPLESDGRPDISKRSLPSMSFVRISLHMVKLKKFQGIG
jgi:hypothetical protein